MSTRSPLLRLRLALLRAIVDRIEPHGWTTEETAQRLGIARPRVVDLLAGRAERFRLDALVTLALRAGLNVRIRATRPYRR